MLITVCIVLAFRCRRDNEVFKLLTHNFLGFNNDKKIFYFPTENVHTFVRTGSKLQRSIDKIAGECSTELSFGPFLFISRIFLFFVRASLFSHLNLRNKNIITNDNGKDY